MFFAPWCTHCHDVEPEFGRAGDMSKVDFIFVDCDKYKVFCKQRAVSRFPSFHFYDEGLVYPYEGGRTAYEFLEFISKVKGPALHELESLETFEGYFDVSFVLRYTDEEQKNKFKEIAEENKQSHMHFAALKSDKAELLATGKDYREHFKTTSLTLKDMREFVSVHSLPSVATMEPANLPKVTSFSRGKDLLVLVADLTDIEQATYVNVFTSVALKLRRNKGNLQAAVLDTSKQGEQVEIYELESLPAIIKTRIPADPPQVAIYTGNITKEAIEEVALNTPMVDISPSYKFRFKKMLQHVFSWKFVENNSGWFFLTGIVITVCIMVGFMAGEEEQPKEEKEE